MPFQRTGAFPLDRTGIFSSLDDAKLYATKGKDLRGLSGTSYIGQIIVVYENDTVSAYIIANQTDSDNCLMKLAQSSASGDIAEDVANLKTQVSNIQASVGELQTTVGGHTTTIADIEGRLQTIEGLPEITYEIAPGAAEGQIQLICKHDGVAYGTPINAKVNGWDTLVAIANGHTRIYVYKNKSDEQYVAALASNTSFKVGDMILFKDANISDQWVTKVLETAVEGNCYEFEEIDIDTPDLANYYTKDEVDAAIAAGVAAKANQSALDSAIERIAANETAIAGKAAQTEVDTLKQTVADLDTTVQGLPTTESVDGAIQTALSGLENAGTEAGGNKYVTKVTQTNGKVEAQYAELPDYSAVYETKGAAEEVKTALETKIGDVGDGSVQEYVDDQVSTVDAKVDALDAQVKAIPTITSGEEVGLDAANKLELKKVSVDKLYIPEGSVLILNGGNSVR